MTALASIGGISTLLAACYGLWQRYKRAQAESQRDSLRRDLVLSRGELSRAADVILDKQRQIDALADEVVKSAADPALASALARMLSGLAGEDN